MRVVCDVEGNSLDNPSEIWVIVCKDIDTGELHVFRRLTQDLSELQRFQAFSKQVTYWVGHNWLDYDWPCLSRLCGLVLEDPASVRVSLDTLVLSRLADYSFAGEQQRMARTSQGGQQRSLDKGTIREGVKQLRQSHSLEAWGQRLGFEKSKFANFTAYSQELEDRCVRDVEITHRLYDHLSSVHSDPSWHHSIELEQRFQLVVNALHSNGFYFNSKKASDLLTRVTSELAELDKDVLSAFPPQEKLIREFSPKGTKFGTISKTSVPRTLWPKIAEYEIGKTYRHTSLVPFNPASHKQVISVLNDAGWKPEDKTQSHIDTERELRRNKTVDLETKLTILKVTGWKINENNLSTLPTGAPKGAKLLAKRILLESRRRTLTEWLSLVQDDGRIHGKFYGIGAWTHRMAHQEPNTANIPNEFDTQGKKKLLGKEMRSLWCSPKKRLLVGVDAEGIQLRIFAHYIDDKEFTNALVNGSKVAKTDPHSLNQRILGDVCRSRQAAKRFIYALLLGAGLWKLSQILECSESECKEALNRLLERYSGWTRLREKDIPRDAARGWLLGLDNRKIQIPGSTKSERSHLWMSGALQNGEAVVMKKATLKWMKEIEDAKEGKQGSKLQTLARATRPIIVNFVHDEWQTETSNDMAAAIWVADTQSRSLREVGEELGLKCPLAGSYWNEDAKDYTIGTNWSVTH